MKNKVFALLTAVVLCLTMIIPASAAGTHIFDPTNVFGNQISTLEDYAQRIEDTYNYSVIVAVVDAVADGYTYGYCEDLYGANAAKENGIALTYNYGDNKYAFYCAGEAETLFPEDVQSNTLWNAFAYTPTYYEGAYAYLAAVEAILSSAPAVTDTTATVTESTEPATEFAPTDRTLPLVVDNADVLTDAEEADFTAKLEALGTKYELEVAILTVNGCEGKEAQDYGDDFYDYNGYGYGENDDGLLIVFNTGVDDGVRNITLTTHGKAIELITNVERDVIFDMMIAYLEKGEYAEAFDTFIVECESAIDTSVPFFYIPLSILIGFALAFIVMKIQASKLKTVRKQVDAASYVGNVNLTYQSDIFIYKSVSKVKRSSSSSSDGSSTHTSSSGRTHGGGSRNF